MKQLANHLVLIVFASTFFFPGTAFAVCMGSLATGGDSIGYRFALAYIDTLKVSQSGQIEARFIISESLSATDTLSRDVARVVARKTRAEAYECASSLIEPYKRARLDPSSTKQEELMRSIAEVLHGVFLGLAGTERAYVEMLKNPLSKEATRQDLVELYAQMEMVERRSWELVLLGAPGVANSLVIIEEQSSTIKSRLTKEERDDLIKQIDSFWGNRARTEPNDEQLATEMAASLLLKFLQ